MCTFTDALGGALGVAGNYFGQQAMASQAQSQMDAQRTAAVTQMNYAFQNYEMERSDAFDSAVNELTKIRQNALQLNSGVKAAVAENISGRTANLIVRNTEGDTARATASVKDNYSRKSNEIDLNKETAYLSTKRTIDNLNRSAPQMPSRFANFVSTAGIALGAYTNAQNKINHLRATTGEGNPLPNGGFGGASLGKSGNYGMPAADRDWLGWQTNYTWAAPQTYGWQKPKKNQGFYPSNYF